MGATVIAPTADDLKNIRNRKPFIHPSFSKRHLLLHQNNSQRLAMSAPGDLGSKGYFSILKSYLRQNLKWFYFLHSFFVVEAL
jgi:hypothetical protein